MDNSVFDILIYVFDRYMLEELPASAERETLARDLESAGFGEANVERALDWLADLAAERERPNLRGDGSFRVFAAQELARLDPQCRGLLVSLEAAGILSPSQREIVIDRLLALDTDELDRCTHGKTAQRFLETHANDVRLAVGRRHRRLFVAI